MNQERLSSGAVCLGIELGSTRIKAVLTDPEGRWIETGIYDWENQLVDGIWTYRPEEIRQGVQGAYRSLNEKLKETYGQGLTKIAAMGISAMMHGYLAFDQEGQWLSPFQTWRNTNTTEAAQTLTDLFQWNVPLRWSIAHLYQRILDQEPHVKELHFLTTLSGYVHYLLTGQKILGIGDASGMFPIDSIRGSYDLEKLAQFDQLIAPYGYSWKLEDLLPQVAKAGEEAGRLTPEGALFLDPTGALQAGSLFAPPEGDAGTGMTATHALLPNTGNCSAGTSTFAMVVLDHPLQGIHSEIDLVTTPEGRPVAMAHANNGTSDLNAWVKLFEEVLVLFGQEVDANERFERLFLHSLKGAADGGGMSAIGYYSGEAIPNLPEGRPLFVRRPESPLTLANFMRAHIYGALAVVKIGFDILKQEGVVELREMVGHGGLFKTAGVAQRYLSAAIDAPVVVMETANEGGAWGMALLACYRLDKKEGEGLTAFLDRCVFDRVKKTALRASSEEVAAFERYMADYQQALFVEREAVKRMH